MDYHRALACRGGRRTDRQVEGRDNSGSPGQLRRRRKGPRAPGCRGAPGCWLAPGCRGAPGCMLAPGCRGALGCWLALGCKLVPGCRGALGCRLAQDAGEPWDSGGPWDASWFWDAGWPQDAGGFRSPEPKPARKRILPQSLQKERSQRHPSSPPLAARPRTMILSLHFGVSKRALICSSTVGRRYNLY